MTLETIKAVLAKKGYEFFEGERNINLIGIRNNDSLTNEFDDKLLVVIQLNGETQVKEFEDFTTDPGHYYLKEKFLNKDGCAIMKPDQYRRMWKLGLHRGKYPALVQVGNCIVYRDANKDELIDKGIEDNGVFGINMHHAYDAEEINRNSAGCQVHSEKDQLNYILQLCKISAEVYGVYFTYTLLESKDFDGAIQAGKVAEVRKQVKQTGRKRNKNRNRKRK